MNERDDQMNRFAHIRSWTWHHKPTGMRCHLRREREDAPHEGQGAAFEELTGAADAALSDDWIGYGTVERAVYRPPPEPDDQSPEDRQARVTVMAAKLKDAGVEGSEGVRNVLPGWLTPMEIFTDGMVQRLALHDGPCRVVIQDIKEKWGTLRLSIRTEPEDLAEDITTISRWAEACTVGRCAVTGRPGEVVGPGWRLTLTPEMVRIRDEDREKFDRLLSTGATP